jgi:DNA-binding IclR family transcriptional regulator
MDYAKEVPTVIRALNLLEALSAAPEGLTAGELLQKLDLSRSTLFALLNTLKAHRYVEQPVERGPYRLGSALYALLPAQSRQLTVLTEAFFADPEITSLPETAVLARLDKSETVILAQQESAHPVRVVLQPGARQAASKAAHGLVLLAGQPDTAGVEPAKTARTELAEVPGLRQIRQEGLAQTRHNDVVEIAVPICADGTQPAAALFVSIPAYRYNDETAVALIQSLRQIAARLSYRLGAPVYQPYGWASGAPLEPTTVLNVKEIDHFLRQPWGARLACIRSDGAPHVVPLWYEWDGRFLWLVASPGAYWQGYVRENGRVSLSVDEPWPPLRRVLIVGQAEPVANDGLPGGLTGLRQRLAARYLGQGALAQAGYQDTAGWLAFRVTPEKISGYQGLGPVVGNR